MWGPRPGPSRLPPGLRPGGWVVHWYEMPSGRLVHLSTVGPEDLTEATAKADQAALGRSGARAVGLVIYDGDTGKRVTI